MSNVAELQEMLDSADAELSESNPSIAVEEASGLDELSQKVVQVISDQFDAIQRNSSIFDGANASNPVYVNPDDFIFRTPKAPERTTVEIITIIPNLDRETPHPNATLANPFPTSQPVPETEEGHEPPLFEEAIEPESEEASDLSTVEATDEMITTKDSTPSPLTTTTLLNGSTAQAAVEEKTTVNKTEEVTGLSTDGSTGESITIKDSTPSPLNSTTIGSVSRVVNVEEETTVNGSTSSSTTKSPLNASKSDWEIIFPGHRMTETDAKKTTVRSEGITGQTVSNGVANTRNSTSSLGKVTPSGITQATTRGTREEQSTEAQTELPVLVHSSEHSAKVETSTNVKDKDETSTHLPSQEGQKTTGSGPKIDI